MNAAGMIGAVYSAVDPLRWLQTAREYYGLGKGIADYINMRDILHDTIIEPFDLNNNQTKKNNYKDQIIKNKKYRNHLLKKIEKLTKEKAITPEQSLDFKNIIRFPVDASSKKHENVIRAIYRAEEKLKFRKINAVKKQKNEFIKIGKSQVAELRQDTVNAEHAINSKTLDKYKKNKNPDDLHKSQIEIYKTRSALNKTALAQQKDLRGRIHAYRGSKEYLNSPDSRYKLHTSKLANTVLAREKNLQADNLKYAIWESELRSLDKLKEDRKNGKQTDMSEYLEKIVRSGIRSEDSLYGIKKGTDSILNHLKGRMSESVIL